MFDPHLQENGDWKPYKGYMTDILVDEALVWIRRNRGPWFCYLALNAPHEPLQVGDEWAKPYLEAGLPPRLATFYGMIANLDAQLGRLTDGLRNDGTERRTVVVFLGDNGTALGGDPQPGEFTGGLRGTKGSSYQGGVRIPAIFSWPGHFPEDRRVGTLAGLCDVLPTLAALCALDLKGFPETDGRSLAPILLAGGQSEGWEDRALPVHVARWPANTPVDTLPFLNSSIRTQRHSLVNGSELYDLEADPGEERNIAASRPDVVERLLKTYLGWWNGVKDSAMETQPFVLGRPGTGPVELTCMDWSPGRTSRQPLPVGLWEQKTIAAWTSGKEMSGVDGGAGGWMVRVETPGTYMIELRRRPAGAAEPAHGAAPSSAPVLPEAVGAGADGECEGSSSGESTVSAAPAAAEEPSSGPPPPLTRLGPFDGVQFELADATSYDKLAYTHIYIFDWVFSQNTLRDLAQVLQRSPFYILCSFRKVTEWWGHGLVKIQPVAKLQGFRTTGGEGMTCYVYINLEKVPEL
jgi:hypothetical protein